MDPVEGYPKPRDWRGSDKDFSVTPQSHGHKSKFNAGSGESYNYPGTDRDEDDSES